MDTSSTFLFEVIFRDSSGSREERHDAPGSDRSVIVEVEPDNMVRTTSFLSGEGARERAKEMVPQFAMQVVQKDLPHGFEPSYSVMEIDRLPRHLHNRPPKFQGNRFRAWLL
jgi:hypothetical protein